VYRVRKTHFRVVTPEKGLGGPEIAPVGTFPPALPSRVDRRPIRLAFLESQFATVPLALWWRERRSV
tara:strand:+ start:591 stop:791 length:201 start_codon:yes stop_codon:yes gene_type:complete